MTYSTKLMLAASVVASVLALEARRAQACGCVAPPDPVTPVVQAGERIVFAQKDGIVTAHIQIQYRGSASEFAWLVPVPAVPKVKVGTEELFAQIEAATAPSFLLNNTGAFCGGGGFGIGCGSSEAAPGRIDDSQEKPPVLVEASSAGPYDYAVLRADDKTEMLAWLSANRFFVPVGTDDAVGPYIHPGAYFLALKLRAGETEGSIQPVVLEYASDFPMVPIILTSVAAAPDMGILVWVLGEHRAIPRNYEHVVINEEHIDWFNGAQNYAAVVKAAIDEADEHHAFITEYAGSTASLIGVLDPLGRFPDRAMYEARQSPVTYLEYARRDFDWAALLPILKRHFPIPPKRLEEGITEAAYYADLEDFLKRETEPVVFDRIQLTADIWERWVTPTLEAGQLFRDHSKMTRLYTVLSPEEMTEDPVFAFNPELPDVPSLHTASFTNRCDDEPLQPLTLPDGRVFETNATEWAARDLSQRPKALRVEILREEGQPMIVRSAPEVSQTDPGGCTSTHASRSGAFSAAMLLASVLLLRRTRRT